MVIEVYYEGEKTLYHLKRYFGSSVNEKILLSKKDKLIILRSTNRKQKILTFTTQGPLCVGIQDTEWEKFKKNISEISAPLVNKSTEAFVGDQCFDTVEPETYTALTSSVKEIFAFPGKTSNPILDCLEGNKTKDLFIKKFGEKDGILNYEKAVIGFKNSIIKFSNMKTGDDPILVCKKSADENIEHPMKVIESGAKIQFQFGKKVDLSKIKEQLFHESIHISSVSDEDLSQAVTSLCINQKVTNVAKLKQDARASLFSSALTTLDISEGEFEAAVKGSQEIPKSVAENPKHPTKDQSPQDMNRMADSGGKQLVASESRAQTSGVVRMAEAVLGPSPAVAAEPAALAAASPAAATESAIESSNTSVSASSARSAYSNGPVTVAETTSASVSTTSRKDRSSSREPASEYQLDMSTVGGKTPKINIPTASSQSGKAGNGEYIKEEVDLTRTATSANSSSNGSRQPAAVNAGSGAKQAQNTDHSISDIGNSGGGSVVSTTSSGAASANLDRTPSSGSRIQQQRRGSSTSSGSNSGTYTPGRDEVVSFISGGSYQQARSKLKDKNFVQTLKDNSITVYDLSGNTYGASRGDVIFVDQGDRFVRQK
ncbi:hypothetical protein [uncultured Bdellovibrio sp.]|uniref:hypothetical protein n=1 Tax=Bdellovibrio sp. HCB-162 TaxID=3394234 RepID=UPI0025F7619E|nr:hypothetical protein [uncultured Bdellovibrio sp.]